MRLLGFGCLGGRPNHYLEMPFPPLILGTFPLCKILLYYYYYIVFFRLSLNLFLYQDVKSEKLTAPSSSSSYQHLAAAISTHQQQYKTYISNHPHLISNQHQPSLSSAIIRNHQQAPAIISNHQQSTSTITILSTNYSRQPLIVFNSRQQVTQFNIHQQTNSKQLVNISKLRQPLQATSKLLKQPLAVISKLLRQPLAAISKLQYYNKH